MNKERKKRYKVEGGGTNVNVSTPYSLYTPLYFDTIPMSAPSHPTTMASLSSCGFIAIPVRLATTPPSGLACLKQTDNGLALEHPAHTSITQKNFSPSFL